MRNKISVNEALDILADLPVAPAVETVPLFQAQGRVLAEDFRAVQNVPPFDRSPYDGYALRGEDTAAATADKPVVLRITEELPAGKAPEREVTPGTAAKILTGAPVPPGANAIVKFEVTEFTSGEVKIFEPVKPDTDIVYAGEDVKAGQLLAEKGSLLSPAIAGAMAGQGLAEVKVFRRPRAMVLCTGSELLEPGQAPEPAKIYNSNAYTISAYLGAMGVDCVSGGSMPDEPERIAQRISGALSEYDLVVTTGGASVGDYDYAVRSAELTGANVLFWKLAMKPGGSVVAAEKDGKLILSLSGNPGAAVITLLRVASAYVKRLCGRKDTGLEAMELVMKEPFKKKSPQQRLIRGQLSVENGVAYFVPRDGQGNGVISSLIGCDVLAEVPAGSPPIQAGECVRAYKV